MIRPQQNSRMKFTENSTEELYESEAEKWGTESESKGERERERERVIENEVKRGMKIVRL